MESGFRVFWSPGDLGLALRADVASGLVGDDARGFLVESYTISSIRIFRLSRPCSLVSEVRVVPQGRDQVPIKYGNTGRYPDICRLSAISLTLISRSRRSEYNPSSIPPVWCRPPRDILHHLWSCVWIVGDYLTHLHCLFDKGVSEKEEICYEIGVIMGLNFPEG